MTISLLKLAKVKSKEKDTKTNSFSQKQKGKMVDRGSLYLSQVSEVEKEKRKKKKEETAENRRLSLNIAMHNINGLKTCGQKIETLYDWLTDNEIDILGLAETNISTREGFFLTNGKDNYKSFWANASLDKKKGSGVGLLVNEQWERHLGQVDRVNEYMITANFFFKQMEVLIMMIYMPPNNKEKRKIIQKKVIEKFINRRPRIQIVIMGDFNGVVDTTMDRSQTQKQRSNKKDPLIGWLE